MKILLLVLSIALSASAQTTNLVAHPAQLQIMGQMDEAGAITSNPRLVDVLQPIVQITNPDTRTQELLSGLIALATTAFGIWMRYQKTKATAAHIGTIQGVEEIRTALQQTEKGRELDAKVVESLIRHQEATGTSKLVQQLIEKHTGSTSSKAEIKTLIE